MQSAFQMYKSKKATSKPSHKKMFKRNKLSMLKKKKLINTNTKERSSSHRVEESVLDLDETKQEEEIENVDADNSMEVTQQSADVETVFHEHPEKVFEWLVAPLEPAEFFKTKWEKVPIHIKRVQNDYYQQILTTKKLQSIFLENNLMYTRNVDVVSYSNNQRETHNVEGRAVPAALWDYYKNGCSIRILNPHTYCTKLHSLLASLQEHFGCMAGVNAYLTPPGSQGFAPHYDDIEAFVLQLEGRKHWRLYPPLNPSEVLPRYSSKNLNRNDLVGKTQLKELTLEAGDLLYFPRGTIHEGFTDENAHSLHITVSVYQKTAYTDLMEHVLKYTLEAAASDDVEFRQGLPLQYLKHTGFANSATNSSVRTEIKNKVKNLLTKMIKYIDVDSASDQLGKQFMWDSMPPIPSKSEKQHMMMLNGEKISDGKIYDSVNIDLHVEVRLLRYHCLRLVKDDDDEGNLRIYYNLDNAKYYHGEELQFLVIDDHFANAVKCLITSYPNFVKIKSLPLRKDTDKMQIVSDLWEKGLLVTKTPLPYHVDSTNFISKWRYWIIPLAVFLYALAVLVFVPLFLVKSVEDGFNKREQEILIAGVFVGLAVPISLWEILQHVIHYTEPKLQKPIIRILWMVPIYAINAWLVLLYPKESIYMDSVRECYEAYVIYNFMKFLLNYLNAEMDLEANLELKPQVKHIFPLCCLPDWEMGRLSHVNPLWVPASCSKSFSECMAVSKASLEIDRYQNFLICIEMCMAAVAHHYSFSHKQYVNEESSQNCCQAFLAMWDVSDVQHDIQEHLGIVSSSISRRIRGRSMYNFARGTDEYATLVSRPSTSVPTDMGLYQNDDEELFMKYGSVDNARNNTGNVDKEKNFDGIGCLSTLLICKIAHWKTTIALKMVVIHIKQNDHSLFLVQTTLDTTVDQLTTNVVAIYNGRLKVERICAEMEELAKHGTLYPPEILGLTEEQVEELKLKDHWGEQCIPSGGFTFVKDPIGRRNGKQPKKEMQDLINNTIKEAKAMISKNLAKEDKCLTPKIIQNAIDILKGAVMIVYPMKLPPHDVIRMEFENIEDLSGTQASLDVIDPMAAQIWFCGKEMYRDGKIVRDYVGKIENCKVGTLYFKVKSLHLYRNQVIMKLTKRGQGAPGREPVMTEDERKQWMLHAYRRQEELKKLDADDDDSYLNSEWADNGNLKRAFHGIQNISWRPGK
ncbi:hypothetical protein FQR65_LT04394 [Abscondita terminalis]|nr:hypothetical protein FQR65_LT04394 [Abscondita terminalis]